jgi:hypothetical protein
MERGWPTAIVLLVSEVGEKGGFRDREYVYVMFLPAAKKRKG